MYINRKEKIIVQKLNTLRYRDYCKNKSVELKENQTIQERMFEDALNISKLPYEKQKVIRTKTKQIENKGHNKIFIVDFLIVKNIVVEIDGGYHTTEEQKEKDMYRDYILDSLGYIIYRIPNKDIEDGKSLEILRRIYKDNNIKFNKDKGVYEYDDLTKRRIKKKKENYTTKYKD